MNAKFEWFGISVMRKHVYFYTVLVLASLAANLAKEQLLGKSDQTKDSLAELSNITEQVASLQAMPPQPQP